MQTPALLYNLNAARAERIQQRLEVTQDPSARLELYYTLGQELLASGQINEALAILNGVTAQIPLSDNSKPLYDTEAMAYLRLGGGDQLPRQPYGAELHSTSSRQWAA